jgi:hypothetical protein
MLNTQTATRSVRFWETVTYVFAAIARKGGGSLTENPLPELRFTAREWDHAAERPDK